MGDFPELESDNLVLREITVADAEDLFSIHRDADHMKWFGSDPLLDLDGAANLVQTFAKWREEPASGARWALELKHKPGLIGTCGLFRWKRDWKTCVTGYEISPLHQGRGYMSEALSTILAWGFAEMALNRVEAHVHPGNQASLKLLGKLGFVEEGRLRQAGYWSGVHHDLLLLSLLRQEWKSGGSC